VQGVPLVGYPRAPGAPPVTVVRWTGGAAGRPAAAAQPHAHDFLVLLYVERGDGELRVDDHGWPLHIGDAFVVAPGAVVRPDPFGQGDGLVWVVFFPSDVVDPGGPGPLVSWRSHPLLLPFARGLASGAQRLRVPVGDRQVWSEHLAALEQELRERRDSYADAARALLTLLLVRLSRLDGDVPHGLRSRREPLLAAVFDVIETRYHESISLTDVAGAVGRSPGHVTTVVARRTGRTVQQWIIERQMQEARRLLVDTDLTVAAVAAHVGYRDAAYFIRRFRLAHGVPPAAWRLAGRR
jgi:AraC family transcriptional regulator, transcriptional activator of pobA